MKSIQLLNIVSKYYTIDENIYLLELLKGYKIDKCFCNKIKIFSNNLVNEMRKNFKMDNVDNILGEYNLSNKEGIQLMCMAESLIRIPDFLSKDSFIKDKVVFENWEYYYSSDYWKILFYNLVLDLLSNLYYNELKYNKNNFINIFKKTIVFFSNYIMEKIGGKFVYSNNITTAINKSINDEKIYSFDMLGEAAITFYDAKIFYNQYKSAIKNINNVYINKKIDYKIPSISIKLSALHPKFSFTNRINVYRDLIPLLKSLIDLLIKSPIQITIDAEECDRVEITLGIFNSIFFSKFYENWENFGIVVQAYSKRALPILYWLNQISIIKKKKIQVRLVKGAYWDYEIKFSQTLNLKMYPVYINKFCTDLSYLLCSVYLLSNSCNINIFPQFATHNIQTISFILILGKNKSFEFQKLYGMGNLVYLTLKIKYGIICREYAPIGKYKELLPYLVRRLLENGANSSFVNKVINKNINYEIINKNPIFNFNIKKYNLKIPLPYDLFGGRRKNLYFYNLNISFHNYIFYKKIKKFTNKKWISQSFFKIKKIKKIVFEPSNKYSLIGILKLDNNIDNSIKTLKNAFNYWKNVNIKLKIKFINNFIDLLKKNYIELIFLCCKEAGKTLNDSIVEIKEAIDFCHYYKKQVEKIDKQRYLPSITGEDNVYLIEGKGIIAAISPWNFPIAIFCGQIIAGLLTGNVILSKPAENTSIIASKIIKLIYKSGFPISVCQMIVGSGSKIGNKISFNKDIYGVIFTGSNNVANIINKNLIMRDNRPIHKLIAETGGINVMIADSTTLVEQLVNDVVESAFKSCGQRCSALRLLYINENIYLDTLKLLINTIKILKIGYPLNSSTDIGPVINKNNLLNLKNYIVNFDDKIFDNLLRTNIGNFIFPTILRVNGINEIKSEQFGPILHIAIYKNKQINKIIKDINKSEFGLTFGIHSRNEAFYKYLSNKLNVGNIYINRNIIGALVGMQPFGGNNLSGTGPKAGGCNYLLHLINEKTITINTTAVGGSVSLLNE